MTILRSLLLTLALFAVGVPMQSAAQAVDPEVTASPPDAATTTLEDILATSIYYLFSLLLLR